MAQVTLDYLRVIRDALLPAQVVRRGGRAPRLEMRCVVPSCIWTAKLEPNAVLGAAGDLVLRRQLYKHYIATHVDDNGKPRRALNA